MNEDPREPKPPFFCHFFHVSSPKKKVSTAKWHPTNKIKTRTNPTHIGENENENNWIVRGKEDEGKKEGSRESPFVEILYLDEASFFFFFFFFFFSFLFADKEESIVTKIIYSETFCSWRQVKEQGYLL